MRELRWLSIPLLCGLLIQVTALSSTREEPVEPSLADPDSARVAGVLDQLEKNWESGNLAGQSYHLSEAELNAYLGNQLRQQEVAAIKSVSVSLKEGGLKVDLAVDPQRLGLKGEAVTSSILGWLLGATPTLEVEGLLQSENGQGTFEIEKTSLNGIPLPAGLVQELLGRFGRQQDPVMDLSQTFQLPYGLESITCHAGSVTLLTLTDADLEQEPGDE